jgi:thymidylate synthase ThyX
MWHTVIVTATEWDNFWNLRCHADAQPEIRLVAETMRDARAASEPAELARASGTCRSCAPRTAEEDDSDPRT